MPCRPFVSSIKLVQLGSLWGLGGLAGAMTIATTARQSCTRTPSAPSSAVAAVLLGLLAAAPRGGRCYVAMNETFSQAGMQQMTEDASSSAGDVLDGDAEPLEWPWVTSKATKADGTRCACSHPPTRRLFLS